MLSHDTRLRCDLVDLYYKLYGSKRPTCLPIPELAGVLKPQKHQSDDSKKKPFFSDKPSTSGIETKHSAGPPKEKVDVVVPESMDCVNVDVGSNVRPKEEITDDVKMEMVAKSVPKQEYFSDNSVSLPGLMGPGGPVGFEPGMFKKEGDNKHKSDPSLKV